MSALAGREEKKIRTAMAAIRTADATASLAPLNRLPRRGGRPFSREMLRGARREVRLATSYCAARLIAARAAAAFCGSPNIVQSCAAMSCASGVGDAHSISRIVFSHSSSRPCAR